MLDDDTEFIFNSRQRFVFAANTEVTFDKDYLFWHMHDRTYHPEVIARIRKVKRCDDYLVLLYYEVLKKRLEMDDLPLRAKFPEEFKCFHKRISQASWVDTYLESCHWTAVSRSYSCGCDVDVAVACDSLHMKDE